MQTSYFPGVNEKLVGRVDELLVQHGIDDNQGLRQSLLEEFQKCSYLNTVARNYTIGDELKLSTLEHRALIMLYHVGTMTAGDLATCTNLTTGAVTGLVDRLERDEWLKREYDPKDRRRVIISLQPKTIQQFENLIGKEPRQCKQ